MSESQKNKTLGNNLLLIICPTVICCLRLSYHYESDEAAMDFISLLVFMAGFTMDNAYGRTYGDLNGDSAVNLSDAVLALRAAVGLDTISDEALYYGDVAPGPA